ncbi:MAG: glycine zipper 2TM domain-containing protein [Burkholderiales bacterium]|nr:glycine zipper 2TM domain-containing protein [Burkholderiales bacterium]
MSATRDTQPAPATRNLPALLYPTLLIAGIAVIIASMLGIAAMTGLLPVAQSQISANQQPLHGEAPAAYKDAAPATRRDAARPAAEACTACGVVESVRIVETAGEGSGAGAVAGGLVGGILGNQIGGGSGRTAMTVVGAGAGAYAGHELEKNMKKNQHYEIRVRMDDRSVRTFTTAGASVGVGQRVRIRDGRPVPAG